MFIPDILADVFDNVDAIPHVVKEVTVFEWIYTRWKNPGDSKERLRSLLDLATHAAVLAPTVSTAQLHLHDPTGGKTYLYQFSSRPNHYRGAFPLGWMARMWQCMEMMLALRLGFRSKSYQSNTN